MSVQVLTVDLQDGPAAVAAYREHHRRVWPEVIDSLGRAGIVRLGIYLLGRRGVPGEWWTQMEPVFSLEAAEA